MSETVTLSTGESDEIYGTFADAKTYLALAIGVQYTTWRALDDDDKKRTLATARRYIDRFAWNDATAGSFAVRDAIVVDGDPLFPLAEYELAALAAVDPDKLSTSETGSNIRSAGAGTARVEFFAPSSVAAGTSDPLPDVAMQLIGSYLASAGGSDLSYGQSGNCESAFDREHEFEIWRPK